MLACLVQAGLVLVQVALAGSVDCGWCKPSFGASSSGWVGGLWCKPGSDPALLPGMHRPGETLRLASLETCNIDFGVLTEERAIPANSTMPFLCIGNYTMCNCAIAQTIKQLG